MQIVSLKFFGESLGAGEVTQQVRTSITLPEDPGSIPGSTWRLTTVYNSSSRGPDALTQTHIETKHQHVQNKINEL